MEAGFGRKELVRRLMADKEDGRIKLYLTYRLVNFRRENRALFEKGEYLPLEARGRLAENVCAFARRGHGKSLIIAAPRFVTKIVPWPELPLGEKVWSETSLMIPFARAGARYRQVLTGENVTALELEGNYDPSAGRGVCRLPVAVLESIDVRRLSDGKSLQSVGRHISPLFGNRKLLPWKIDKICPRPTEFSLRFPSPKGSKEEFK